MDCAFGTHVEFSGAQVMKIILSLIFIPLFLFILIYHLITRFRNTAPTLILIINFLLIINLIPTLPSAP